MRRDKHIRADKLFVGTLDTLKRELEPVKGRKLSYTELTADIGSFLNEENLLNHMVKQGKKSRRRLF